MEQEKFVKYAKWGIIAIALAVVAPIAWLAVSGILGLAIAGGIGLFAINAAPVLALKLSNAKYRAIDAEQTEHIEKVSEAAARNPIETLMDQALEKRQASDQFKSAITLFKTEVKNFKDQIDGFGKEYPEDVARFKTQYDAMQSLLKFREDRYTQLQTELNNFDAAIKRAKAMWTMSLAAQNMNKLAGMELGDPFEKIKADSAINSVMTSMNKAFAEMETALLDSKELKQAQILEISQSFVSEVPVAENSKKVMV